MCFVEVFLHGPRFGVSRVNVWSEHCFLSGPSSCLAPLGKSYSVFVFDFCTLTKSVWGAKLCRQTSDLRGAPLFSEINCLLHRALCYTTFSPAELFLLHYTPPAPSFLFWRQRMNCIALFSPPASMREIGALCQIVVLIHKQCISWGSKRAIFKQLARQN